jgi:hypothetical protein
MSLSRLYLAMILLASLALTLGCGSGQVKVYPVKGKITYGGKPLVGGGSIAFIPLTAQEGKTAGGTILEDGSYVMTTHKEGDGSMAGEFRVAIMQEVFKEPKKTQDGQAAAKATTDVPEADRIPDSYKSFTDSPLKTTIEPQPNEKNFDIPRS